MILSIDYPYLRERNFKAALAVETGNKNQQKNDLPSEFLWQVQYLWDEQGVGFSKGANFR